MSDPKKNESEDLTKDDDKVENTGNQLMPEDAELEQPSQDPAFLPEGTVSEEAE